MFAKSKQIGLVSLFVVLATALGGCAESVGNEPASPANTRPVIALSRFLPPHATVDNLQAQKTEALATHVETKRLARTGQTAIGR